MPTDMTPNKHPKEQPTLLRSKAAPAPPTPEEHEAMVRERIADTEHQIEGARGMVDHHRGRVRDLLETLKTWKAMLPRKRTPK